MIVSRSRQLHYTVIVLTAIGMSSTSADDFRLITPENMCGVLALTCAARASGANVDVEALVERLPLDGQMKSFGDLQRAAARLGLAAKAVRWREGQVPVVKGPCIIRVVPESANFSPHFVVLLAAEGGALRVVDPPQRPVWAPADEILRGWDRVALYVAPDPMRLAALAPPAWPLDEWATVGLATVGVLPLAFLATRLRRRGLGPADGNRPAWRLAALTVAGWLAVGVGSAWSIVGSAVPGRDGTVVADRSHLSIELSRSQLAASGQVARGEFVLINRGRRPAKIVEITPNCSCVEVVASSRTIPPGGRVRIDAAIRLDGDDHRQGRLLVELADSIPQRMTLTLSADRIGD